MNKPKNLSLRVVLWFIALLFFAVPSLHAEQAAYLQEAEAVGRVLSLMDHRMSLMRDVAAWKWQNRSPVGHLKREQTVLDNAVAVAEPLGLPPDAVRRLFEFQIKTGSEEQARLHERWGKEGFDTTQSVPSLDGETRPKLDRLTQDLLRSIYLAVPAFDRPDFVTSYRSQADRTLRAQGWSETSRRQALQLLAPMRLKDRPVLDRIRAAGVLRVGVTGDYPPFSLEAKESLQGADIVLMQSLADSLQVKAVFVRTSWPTLIDDMQRRRFDIAAGGISVTPQREAVGVFSVPYYTGGKTAIARCRDAHRYRSLSTIDRPKTRVIVNPGGTNEQFVRRHLKRAPIRVFLDNRAIFEEIRAGRADVMITDDIEVELQTREHSDLCRTLPGTLTKTDKALFMQPDERFVGEVNAWLSEQIARGEPAKLLSQPMAR